MYHMHHMYAHPRHRYHTYITNNTQTTHVDDTHTYTYACMANTHYTNDTWTYILILLPFAAVEDRRRTVSPPNIN